MKIKQIDHTLATLAFYVKYPGWQSFKTTTETKKAIETLQKKGFLEVGENHQARFTGKVFLDK